MRERREETWRRGVSITLPAGMLEAIDAQRGDVPRSVWITNAAGKALRERDAIEGVVFE